MWLCFRRLLLLALLVPSLALAQGPRSTPGIDTLLNDTTTGTTQYLLAKIVPGSGGLGKLVRAATTDTAIDLYVCLAGCGTSGEAKFIFAGEAPCVMDSTIASGAAGYFVLASTTTAGRCHAQSGPPANGIVVGKLVQDATTTGSTARVLLLNQAYIPGSGAGTGTVTSIGLAMPTQFSVAPPTITTNGVFTVAWQTQVANCVLAGPASGGAAVPTCRTLVVADMPATVAAGAAGGDLGGTYPTPTVVQASGLFALSGLVTPTPLAGDVNDYAGCAGATRCRITGGAADRTLSGLAGGTTGRVLQVCNVGTTNSLLLPNQATASSAANRFAFGDSLTLLPEGCQGLWYDTTSSRWRLEGAAVLDAHRIRTCTIPFGSLSSTAAALPDDDDVVEQCGNNTGRDVKIVGVKVWANSGTPVFNPILRGGVATSILSGACSGTPGAWAACTLQSPAPIIKPFTGTGGTTCATTGCSVDANIQSAGGAFFALIELKLFVQ